MCVLSVHGIFPNGLVFIAMYKEKNFRNASVAQEFENELWKLWRVQEIIHTDSWPGRDVWEGWKSNSYKGK